jgi:hypothetical protein
VKLSSMHFLAGNGWLQEIVHRMVSGCERLRFCSKPSALATNPLVH